MYISTALQIDLTKLDKCDGPTAILFPDGPRIRHECGGRNVYTEIRETSRIIQVLKLEQQGEGDPAVRQQGLIYYTICLSRPTDTTRTYAGLYTCSSEHPGCHIRLRALPGYGNVRHEY